MFGSPTPSKPAAPAPAPAAPAAAIGGLDDFLGGVAFCICVPFFTISKNAGILKAHIAKPTSVQVSFLSNTTPMHFIVLAGLAEFRPAYEVDALFCKLLCCDFHTQFLIQPLFLPPFQKATSGSFWDLLHFREDCHFFCAKCFIPGSAQR